jgi:hypothetical protein
MNLVQRHSSRNMTNTCITIIEGDIALAVALSHNLKTETYRRKRRSRRGSLEKARRRASRSCLSRLDAVRHVGPRNLYPVARAGRDTNAPNYHALGAGEEVLRCAVFPPGRMILSSSPSQNARADSACSCFIATQPVRYLGPPSYSRRSSTRPPEPKGPPGLARRQSQANGIPSGDLAQC